MTHEADPPAGSPTPHTPGTDTVAALVAALRCLARASVVIDASSPDFRYATIVRRASDWLVDLEPGTATFSSASDAFRAVGLPAHGVALEIANEQPPCPAGPVETQVLLDLYRRTSRWRVGEASVEGPMTTLGSDDDLGPTIWFWWVHGAGERAAQVEHETQADAFRSLGASELAEACAIAWPHRGEGERACQDLLGGTREERERFWGVLRRKRTEHGEVPAGDVLASVEERLATTLCEALPGRQLWLADEGTWLVRLDGLSEVETATNLFALVGRQLEQELRWGFWIGSAMVEPARARRVLPPEEEGQGHA